MSSTRNESRRARELTERISKTLSAFPGPPKR